MKMSHVGCILLLILAYFVGVYYGGFGRSAVAKATSLVS